MKMKRLIITIILAISVAMLFGVFVGCSGSSSIEGVRFSRVATGSHEWGSSLAIDRDGNLWEWRNVTYRGSGCASVRYSTAFTQIMVGTDFTNGQISVGGNHSLAIDRNGNLFAWGNNAQGQLGDRTTRNQANPVQIIEGTRFIDVSAGLHFSLAVDVNGGIWAWGRNSNGQVGCGSGSALVSRQIIPIRLDIPNVHFVSVSAGGNHSLALDNEGNIWGWGNNFNGQVGDNAEYLNFVLADEHLDEDGEAITSRDRSDRDAPVRLETSVVFTQVSAGNNHSLALDINGNVWAWGQNSSLQLGIQDPCHPILCGNEVSSENLICSCPVYEMVNNVLTNTGEGGRLRRTLRNRYAPKRVLIRNGYVDLTITSIDAGNSHSMAIDTNGNLWGWGENGRSGRLGNGGTEPGRVPVLASFNQSTNVVLVSAGHSHTMSIDALGNLWTWGSNPGGTIGGGVEEMVLSPKKLT
ncbi:MAG: hypothetical protein FWC11_04810 [Firmicutes bacterium]|nr:hypothetical protein [Bacillota bacterium]